MRLRCIYQVLEKSPRDLTDKVWGPEEHGWLIAILLGTAVHYVIAKEDGYLRRVLESNCVLLLVPEDTPFPKKEKSDVKGG